MTTMTKVNIGLRTIIMIKVPTTVRIEVRIWTTLSCSAVF